MVRRVVIDHADDLSAQLWTFRDIRQVSDPGYAVEICPKCDLLSRSPL